MSIASVLTDYGPDSGGRIKNHSIVKPIVIGNSAKYFGKKREGDNHTHEWKVYLKPYYNEDYSMFIKKVHFKLHDSYTNPTRVITKPPYEVTETGWGEFEIAIKIHFVDPIERPVTVYHLLKLFSPGYDPLVPSTIKKYLVVEHYDEIVFHEPTQLTKTLIEGVKPLSNEGYRHENDFEAMKKTSLAKVTEARSKVKAEVQDMKEKLKVAKETINALKEAVNTLQGDVQGSNPAVGAKVAL